MSYNSKYTGQEVEQLLDKVDDKQDKLISGSNIKTINGKSLLGSGNIQIEGGSGDVANIAERVTYDELKSKRDSGELIAGCWYRIIDYTFTTVQEETKSAGHLFDIIVLAVDEKTFNHNAFAALHEGDDYFANVEIDAWQLKYDLDNDTDKYAWADSTNGKGVIYRMIDEKRNDCPYDFKNALFYNEKITTGTTSDKFYYTFSYVVNDKLYDGTVENLVKKCYGNSMEVYLKSNKKSLNLNVFRCTGFGDNCYSNTFGDSCYNNSFGSGCRFNSFGNICYGNTFGYSCYSNTFGDSCRFNTFGDSCYSNSFGSDCYSNTFGDNVSYHELNSVRTSITLNDEYFDDGSGQLVPIKHPDLSTQPSILPYKFMGQYVYEQLIPIIYDEVLSGPSPNTVPVYNKNLGIEHSKIVFMEAQLIGRNACISTKVSWYNSATGYYLIFTPWGYNLEEITDYDYIRLVYTSMSEEGDYYGYNNY